MAAMDMVNEPHDRQAHRRRPFSTWVKKLTNFKSSSDGDRPKRHMKMKRGPKLNNPYPQSGHVSQSQPNDPNDPNGLDGPVNRTNHADTNGDSSYSFTTARTGSITSLDQPARSSVDGLGLAPTTAGTVSTENEAPRSITPSHGGASSLAGTSRTIGGGIDGRRGGDSTFSSPAPSVRSLTTTLTTIQSVAPNGNTPYVAAPPHSNTQSIQFSQPFPSTSPASAIPSHLAPTSNPTTYTTATANNLLTDNASILTLASSSKRRRRRSMDTDASVRALAPSSLWGGSRESLPLSVLSANIDQGGMPTTPGVPGSNSRLGPERNSIYSSTGVAPAITSERNSILAKQGDGASVRSGPLSLGRPDSISGSIAGVTSPLASPREEPEQQTPKDDGAAAGPKGE
ncbi:hypothetical protein X797_008914 [Metarhizium robertsii]|uniref:Uncharacterized protein n=1 Tax=Metarhizium robertsii TaxID=568076 RepID=A0A014NAM1_9HYPO|nr:hypothetical protein X797_008914 [Metarhizium robertsii]